MSAPEFLYRYRPGDIRDVTHLTTGKLWIANPRSFNDPYDSAIGIVVSKVSTDILRSIIDKANLPEEFRANLALVDQHQMWPQLQALATDTVATQVNNYLKEWNPIKGVCCFAERPDNLLMWSHYTNGHRGICLEFDTTKEPRLAAAMQVQYHDKIAAIDVGRLLVGDGAGLAEQILSLLVTKSEHWKYEHEWRLVDNERGDYEYTYRAGSLTRVYLGAQMPQDQKKLIAAILRETGTTLCQMHLGNDSFDLISRDV